MEGASNDEVGRIVADLLKQVGMDEDTVGDVPWTLTEPAHLEGAAGTVRPGAIKHTFVRKGVCKDKHAVVTIEGFATNAGRPTPVPVSLFQMHVAEGGPVVASADSKTVLYVFNVGVPGLGWLFGNSRYAQDLSFTYGHGKNRSSAGARNLTETTGRLTQARRNYPATTTGR